MHMPLIDDFVSDRKHIRVHKMAAPLWDLRMKDEWLEMPKINTLPSPSPVAAPRCDTAQSFNFAATLSVSNAFAALFQGRSTVSTLLSSLPRSSLNLHRCNIWGHMTSNDWKIITIPKVIIMGYLLPCLSCEYHSIILHSLHFAV